jgi:hypothetical protein
MRQRPGVHSAQRCAVLPGCRELMASEAQPRSSHHTTPTGVQLLPVVALRKAPAQRMMVQVPRGPWPEQESLRCARRWNA